MRPRIALRSPSKSPKAPGGASPHTGSASPGARGSRRSLVETDEDDQDNQDDQHDQDDHDDDVGSDEAASKTHSGQPGERVSGGSPKGAIRARVGLVAGNVSVADQIRWGLRNPRRDWGGRGTPNWWVGAPKLERNVRTLNMKKYE